MPLNSVIKSGEASYQTVIQTSPPIGILSIAAYVRQFVNVDIKILDLNILISKSRTTNFHKFEEIVMKNLMNITENWKPEIIGISALFNTSYKYLMQLSRTTRSLWSDALIVTGGALSTNLYTKIFDNIPEIDAVAIAEAEKPVLGLIKAKDRKAYLKTAKGWMTATRAKAGMQPSVDFILNLDEIPMLAYDLIPLDDYQKVTNWHGEVTEKSKIASLITTRGCPYRCSFCANHSMHGQKLRYMTINRVIKDIKQLKEKFGVTVILIEDDSVLTDKKFTIKLLDGMSKLGLKYDLSNGLGVNHVNQDIIDRLKSADINKVTLAIESGSEYVLKKLMNKPWVDLSLAHKAVKMLRDNGFYITGTFIIGLPGETMDEVKKTVKFIKEIGLNWSKIFIATPVAGSDLYNTCIENNYLITNKLEDFHFAKSVIRTPNFEPQEIDNLKYQINLEVNFVENYDLKCNNPKTALISFEDVIRRVPDHAFAHYYIHRCYDMMGKKQQAATAFEKYKLYVKDKGWAKYAKHFGLPLEIL